MSDTTAVDRAHRDAPAAVHGDGRHRLRIDGLARPLMSILVAARP